MLRFSPPTRPPSPRFDQNVGREWWRCGSRLWGRNAEVDKVRRSYGAETELTVPGGVRVRLSGFSFCHKAFQACYFFKAAFTLIKCPPLLILLQIPAAAGRSCNEEDKEQGNWDGRHFSTMNAASSQPEPRWSDWRHYITKKNKKKETLLVLCALKKGIAKSEKKKKPSTNKTKEKIYMNDFISWTLPNMWDISEVIIEVWLIRQQ